MGDADAGFVGAPCRDPAAPRAGEGAAIRAPLRAAEKSAVWSSAIPLRPRHDRGHRREIGPQRIDLFRLGRRLRTLELARVGVEHRCPSPAHHASVVTDTVKRITRRAARTLGEWVARARSRLPRQSAAGRSQMSPFNRSGHVQFANDPPISAGGGSHVTFRDPTPSHP
jgi:hypothetical protein